MSVALNVTVSVTAEYCNEAVFLPLGKKTLDTGVRTGCHYLISLSVCLSVCVAFVVFTDCKSCTRPIFTNPGSVEALSLIHI